MLGPGGNVSPGAGESSLMGCSISITILPRMLLADVMPRVSEGEMKVSPVQELGAFAADWGCGSA